MPPHSANNSEQTKKIQTMLAFLTHAAASTSRSTLATKRLIWK
jgi:hypothetical protein